MLKIGELAQHAGISRDALRFYEKHGLITPTVTALTRATACTLSLMYCVLALFSALKKSGLRSMKYISYWNLKSPKTKNLAKM